MTRSRVLATVALCGLTTRVRLANELSIVNPSPALVVEGQDVVIFGVNAICRYLHSKAVGDGVDRVADEKSEAGLRGGVRVGKMAKLVTPVKTPLSVWDVAELCEKVKMDPITAMALADRDPVVKIVEEKCREGRCATQMLSQAFREAVARAFPEFDLSLMSPAAMEVKYDGRKFGGGVVDYTFSGSQQIFQMLKTKYPESLKGVKTPMEAAARIHAHLDSNELSWLVEKTILVGFYVNITISSMFVSERINLYSALATGKADSKTPLPLTPPPLCRPSCVVVDFSSPNIAKEMHVGHLRSTIIGDSLARLFEHMGNNVLRVNHVGDWGTQFGMLLEYLRLEESNSKVNTFDFLNGLSMTDLTKLYQQAKKAFDASDEFKSNARNMVVALQSGKDEHAREVWDKLVEVSKQGFETIYSRLDISFPDQGPGTGYCGESFYQNQIDDAVKALGKLTKKKGDAVLLFTGLAEAKQEVSPDHPEGEIPLFLKKSDGGVGYDSTDVAAIRFRIEKLQADRIMYVTDSGQRLHFFMVFEAAKLAGWTHAKQGEVVLDHVNFGVVKAKDGGKFRTRSGDTVTLDSLLESAKSKMKEILIERVKNEKTTTVKFDDAHIETLSAAIGYSAVKYFDLRTNRSTDYVFDEDLMCSPDGDTAVYLMYAYARICSILDKAADAGIHEKFGYTSVGASDRERLVAVSVSRFNETLEMAVWGLTPHVICGHLYSLASETNTFIVDKNERVWAKKAGPATDNEPDVIEPGRGLQRLLLLRAVKASLHQGLNVLGIQPFDRM